MINAWCVVGLLPFLLIYIIQRNYIALVVFLNGLVYHSSYNTPAYVYLRAYDILANLTFLIWVNLYTSWQPQTFVISLWSCAWYLGNFVIGANAVHVVCVQFPLAVALYRYYKYSPH